MKREKRTTLNKTLKPHWVWAIALGSSIGWGAFVQPTNWMADGGPLGVIAGFGIGALLMMLIAISYGFLIKSFPVSGGEFAYTFISLGRTHAFICGWFLTLGYICIVALNASAFALMFKFIVPKLVDTLFLYEVAGWSVYAPEIIIVSVLLGVMGYFNIRGTGLSGRMQFIFCVVMIFTVVALTIMVGFEPTTSLENMKPLIPAGKTTWAAILSIVAIAPWAFVGFDNIPQAAEEFNFSSKKAFSLIIFSILAAALLYAMMIITVSIITPWEGLVAQDHAWGTAVAIQDLVGNFGLILLIVALTMGIFTGLNGFILSSSRLMFAMSRAKILPKVFSKLHPKYKTPYAGIIFTVLLSMFAPWFGREALIWVVDMSSIGVTIAYFYTCLTAFILFKWSDKKEFNEEKYTVAPVKKLLAGFGVIASVAFLGLLLIPGSPAALGKESLIALISWIVLGIIFYLFKRTEFNKIPRKELMYYILGKEKIVTKE